MNGAQERRSGQPSPLGPHKLVAAIDFGTTFSGYAYSLTNRLDDVKTPAMHNAQFQCRQAPTCLLLRQDKSLEAFGNLAREIYWNFTENEREQYFFFEHFKMRLHQERQLSTSKTKLEDVRGRRIDAIDIFSITIKYLKDHLIDKLEEQGFNFKVEDIKFVLTVPAIWTEPAKQFMRRAATQAGIPSQRLVIALEPEAASIYVQHYYPNGPLVQAVPVAQVGTKYIIADVGGGTADFSIHVKQDDGTLKELHKANGGASGGTYVERKFIELLNSIFGKKTLEDFKRDFPYKYMCLIDNFKLKKMDFDGTRKLVINYADELIRLSTRTIKMKEELRKRLCKINEDVENDINVTHTNGNIEMSAVYAEKFFLPTCEFIKFKIEHLLKEHSDIQMLILVGGFSNNNYLKKYLRNHFHNGPRLIIPEDGSLAVVRGAVLYGFDPLIVSSRVVRFTYGFAVQREFDISIHPPERRYTNDSGKELCRNCFEVLIEEGTVVDSIGNTIEIQLAPVWEKANGALIKLYFTNRGNVSFVEDKGVYPLGECRIEHNMNRPFNERKLQANFRFDGTEVSVYLTNNAGEHVSSSFDMID